MTKVSANRIQPMIIVHGGAWEIPPVMHKAHLAGINTALETGQKMLRETDDALQTVLAIIRYLEDDPTFDAGKGSFLNSAGEVEMDAGVMVGRDLSAGAVAAIQNVRHPIHVADLVRSKTQHCFLVGQGATNFAAEQGVPLIATEQLLVGREKKLYRELKKRGEVRIKSFFELKELPGDTVGAVVINSKGEIVAGTSTGGTPHKLQGRVGDSPIIGSGFYADDASGGASATGWGEGIMRVMLAKTAIDYLKAGKSAQEAADLAIKEMRERVNGDGGIILIDRKGQPAFAYNTAFMAVGAADLEEKLFVSLGK